MELNYNQIQDLIILATSKNWYDYLSLIFNVLISLCAIILTYAVFLKTPKQNRRLKIQEKEIELLYLAFDNFQIFTDTINLYLSNKHRRYSKLQNKKQLEDTFLEKDKASTEKVYNSFVNFNLAVDILRSIGDIETARQVQDYKELAVESRSYIFSYELKENNDTLENLVEKIKEYKNCLTLKKNSCLDSISNFKETMKQ